MVVVVVVLVLGPDGREWESVFTPPQQATGCKYSERGFVDCSRAVG